MKFTEQQLTTWAKPASESEDSRMENSRNAVLTALKNNLGDMHSRIKAIYKGSSHNNTNVRSKADVDVSITRTDVFFFELPLGYSHDHFGIVLTSETYNSYRDTVKNAIFDHFESSEIDDSKNKCTRVLENSYRVDTDIVPAWEFRKYYTDGSYDSGVGFYSDHGEFVVNFPEQHTENGRIKNLNTGKKYKKIVRILKRLRDSMQEDGYYNAEAMTSFLLESLVWNVSDTTFNKYTSLTDILRAVLIEIYAGVKNGTPNWNEVSNKLALFSENRKWKPEDVKSFIEKTWAYAQFS